MRQLVCSVLLIFGVASVAAARVSPDCKDGNAPNNALTWFDLTVEKDHPVRALLNNTQLLAIKHCAGDGVLSLQYPMKTEYGELLQGGVTLTAASNLYLVCNSVCNVRLYVLSPKGP